MYGRLFGDLPPTKEQLLQQPQQQQPSSKQEAEAKKASTSPEQKESKINSETIQSSKKEISSIARPLGTAGTAVAFVPMAARKRPNKRPSPSATTISNHNNQTKCRNTFSNNTEEIKSSSQDTFSTNPSIVQVSKTLSVQEDDNDNHSQHTNSTNIMMEKSTAATTTTTTTTTSTNHNDPNEMETRTNNTTIPSLSFEEQQHEQQHTHRIDRYDPFLPNDLLEYWERKKVQEQVRRAQEEAKQIRMVQAQTVEQVRHDVRSAVSEVSSSSSRGRGRGLSNLPAWMVEQQRKQEALGTATMDVSTIQ